MVRDFGPECIPDDIPDNAVNSEELTRKIAAIKIILG